MSLSIRRPSRTIFYSTLLLVFVLFKIFTTTTEIGRYSWLAILFVLSIQFIGLISRMNYIQIENSIFIISKDFFRTQTFSAHDIELLKIESSPFKSSYFLMKDHSKIKIVDNYFSLDEMKRVMGELRVKIELT